jgi:hypothetical protein
LAAAKARYYKTQAESLDAYLHGQASAGETERKIAENLNNFKRDLVDIEAGDNEQLAKEMQSNLDDVTRNAMLNCSSIYDY